MHAFRLCLSGSMVLIGIGLFVMFLSEGKPITAFILVFLFVNIGRLTVPFSE